MTAQLHRFTARLRAHPMLRRGLLGGAFLGGGALLSAALFATGPEPIVEQAPEKAWPVTAIAIEEATLAPSFRAFGKIESRNTAELAAELQARVTAIHVREGDRVRQGDLLVTLDDEALAFDVAAAAAQVQARQAELDALTLEQAHLQSTDAEQEARVAAANAKLERHEELRGRGLISAGLLDEIRQQVSSDRIGHADHRTRMNNLPNRLRAAQAALDEARARLGTAEVTAGKAMLRAPFDGVVLSVATAVGATTSPFATLLTVADRNAYQVRVPVPPAHHQAFTNAVLEQGTVGIDRGIRGAIRSSDGTRTLAAATFSHLAGAVAGGVPNADALFAFETAGDDALLALPLGSTVELRVELPPVAKVVALPPEALYENARIYRVIDERLQRVAVEQLGTHDSSDGPRVLVRAPELASGQQVIITQLPNPVSGLKVKVAAPTPVTPSDAGEAQIARPEQSPSADAQTRAAALAAAHRARYRADQQQRSTKAPSPNAQVLPAAPAVLLPRNTIAPSAQKKQPPAKQRVASRRYRMA
ncbi:MAG: biotin/lipoyl-binding protein [Pseudomonadota bacterium]